MKEANNIIKDIKNNKIAPIYFLSGEETFYIDLISKTIEEEDLSEEETDLNKNILYGNDVNGSIIISMTKQIHMSAEKQVVIVNEAQHLSRTIEQFEPYFLHNKPSTVLVINYKGKKVDKRTKFFNVIKKNSVFLEASKIYDNQLPQWIETTAKERQQEHTSELQSRGQ